LLFSNPIFEDAHRNPKEGKDIAQI